MATLIVLAIKISIMLLVFSLGLETRRADLTYVLSRPSLLARSFLSIHLIVPVATVLMVFVFAINPTVEIALISLAVSPIPPLLPRKAAKLSDGSYGVGLLVVVALASIVIVPASVELLGAASGRAVHVSFLAVAMVIAQTVLAPLAAGLLVGRFAAAAAERIAGPIARFAPIVLILALLPILYKLAPAMLSLVGGGTLLAIAAFILVGIAVGHLLGGPEPANRTVLAIASSSRHPGVAVAILGANFDNAKPATAAILLYLLVNAVVTIPYQVWRRHAYGDPAEA